MSSRWRWWGLAGSSWGVVLIALVCWRLGGFGSSLREMIEGYRFPTAQFRIPISAPKPGELTEGEWEERVNGVLNLLRRQTEDFETEDRRREGTSPLAGSGAGHGFYGEFLCEHLCDLRVSAFRFNQRWHQPGADVRISAIHACVDRGTRARCRTCAGSPPMPPCFHSPQGRSHNPDECG